jgi:hypothetical protein
MEDGLNVEHRKYPLKREQRDLQITIIKSMAYASTEKLPGGMA